MGGELECAHEPQAQVPLGLDWLVDSFCDDGDRASEWNLPASLEGSAGKLVIQSCFPSVVSSWSVASCFVLFFCPLSQHFFSGGSDLW